jgi:pimeloyl-ACP methyl ester carboxylesterase
MSFTNRLLSALFAVSFASAISLQSQVALAVEEPSYDAELSGFSYPEPVRLYKLSSQGMQLHMAYMELSPAQPNGRTVLLLHGKNFCGATWEASIKVLSNAGFRVIAPDQVGFCKSSKPEHYQYSFQQLARNTHELLESIGVARATIIGHSTGGMLAVRYALMYPQQTEQLVLVAPIGLEDWKAMGVPSLSVDQWYERELQTTAERIRNYEKATYYANQWKPEYEKWVQMLAGMYRGQGRKLVAWNSALIYDMIYTQPVLYEFSHLKTPTLLLIGDKDTTAIGKDAASPEVRAKLGNYPELAKLTAMRIPNATLVEFPELGHAPQLQDPEAFHRALLDGLSKIQ